MLQRKFCLMKACVLHCWLPRYRLWKHTSAWCENISIYNTEYRSLYYSDIYVNINNLEEANLRQWNVSSDEGGKCSLGPLTHYHVRDIVQGVKKREFRNLQISSARWAKQSWFIVSRLFYIKIMHATYYTHNYLEFQNCKLSFSVVYLSILLESKKSSETEET